MNPRKFHRVVVTGMGVISPLGNDLATFCANLQNGRSGEGPITRFNTDAYRFKRAFEVKGFSDHAYRVHILDPFIQYAVGATTEAVADSGLDLAKLDPYRIGISVSSSKGGVSTYDRFADKLRSRPHAILGARVYSNVVPNFAAQWIARRWKINGPARCYVAACATGTVAVIEGARMIQDGIVDCCIAGASDASIVPLMLAGYSQMKALSPDGMRPFDRRRRGFLVGEGAGILILESLEHAQARKARIYGEIVNFSYGSDSKGLTHFSDKTALAHTLQQLLQRCGWKAEAIDYVNLHGTGTRAGDIYETEQLKRAFGPAAAHIPMSSTKSMTGHLLGASGAVEMIATFLAMRDGFIPPTIGLEEPDPACDLDYTPIHARKKILRRAISLSMGFGGHIATIALERFL